MFLDTMLSRGVHQQAYSRTLCRSVVTRRSRTHMSCSATAQTLQSIPLTPEAFEPFGQVKQLRVSVAVALQQQQLQTLW
jgi:hypothetical protein